MLEALLDVAGDLVDVELALRQQDHVGAAGEAGVQRDPAGVPAHHLDDQRAVVVSAVVCSRSIASIAMLTAVSKPNV